MTRHVFPTSEIPHKWAHQTQDAARNPQGNLYFRGPTIYSYRDSWPLARIYRKRGAPSIPLVLVNSDYYSVTTAQHQSAVDRAASHLRRIAVPGARVPYPGAPRRYIARGVSESEALAICSAYRTKHEPGTMSRKAEFERAD